MNDWLRLERLTFSYGERTLFRDLDLEVSREEPVLVIVGPSGVGKTTLINLLAGFLRPDRGRIVIFDEPVTGPSPSRPVVFQDYNLFPWKTVLSNVEVGLKCAGLPAATRKSKALELLANLELQGTEDLFPAELSGGMKQRVGLARVLAISPDCILMDEPFASLDVAMREKLSLEITCLIASESVFFVIVTHDLYDAVFLGNRILALSADHQLSQISIDQPRHPRPIAYRYSGELMKRCEELRATLVADSFDTSSRSSLRNPETHGGS